MELSIILPCFNGYALTEKALRYINNSVLPKEHEIILIDDGSTDKTVIAEHIDKYNISTVVRHTKNKGYGPSCNDAIKLARGEYIALFNNDLFVPKNWYQSTRDIFNLQCVTYNDISYSIGMTSCMLAGPVPNYFGSYTEIDLKEFNNIYKNAKKVDTISFNCLIAGGPWLFRADVFKDVGYFDEQFVPSLWEDIDLFIRMLIKGWMFCATPDSISYHIGSQTVTKQFEQIGGADTIYLKNRDRLINKWNIESDSRTPAIDWENIQVKKNIVLAEPDDTVSLNMIVGKNEEPFLECAILSVLPIVNEVIIVDTAPGNNPNIDIIEQYANKILEYYPKEGELFNFSDARNLALDNSSCNWILRLDSDEVWNDESIEELRNFTNTTEYNCIEIQFYEHVLHPRYTRDVGPDAKLALFKRSDFRWTGNVHECPVTYNRKVLIRHDLKYNHYGWCKSPQEMYNKIDFYNKLVPPELYLTLEHITEPTMLIVGAEENLDRYEGKHPEKIESLLREMYGKLYWEEYENPVEEEQND